MAKKKNENVTMRVRIGENELEVSGPSDFVDKKISEFLKGQKTYEAAISTTSKGKASPKKDAGTTKKMSAAQLFQKIGPKTDVDRTLAACYYLEEFQNSESFTASEVRETIRDAKRNPPTNVNDAINSNIKKGLIMSAGDKDGVRAFVLTSDGEDVINELLAQ